jgi:hypothetical protein
VSGSHRPTVLTGVLEFLQRKLRLGLLDPTPGPGNGVRLWPLRSLGARVSRVGLRGSARIVLMAHSRVNAKCGLPLLDAVGLLIHKIFCHTLIFAIAPFVSYI